jgi:hypothetical protein
MRTSFTLYMQERENATVVVGFPTGIKYIVAALSSFRIVKYDYVLYYDIMF